MRPLPPTSDTLRAAVGRAALASASDGDLVRRFAATRDDLAFTELVQRLAPAVYALCRKHLRDPAAADDAFQNCFVLLARRAATLSHPDRVAGWVVGVADRIARAARAARRRHRHFRPLASAPEPAAPVDAEPTDLKTVLDAELALLPPHYRQAVTLCDLQGVPRRTAATQLGVPVATLGHRLTRARAVLGRRLLRRGVLLGVGGLLAGSVAKASPQLLAAAVRAALDTPLDVAFSLPLEVLPVPRAKLILGVIGGLVVLGVGVTTVVLLTKPNTPVAATTDTGTPGQPPSPKPTGPQTYATGVVPPDPNRKPPPWVEPKFGERISSAAFTADGKRAVMLQSHRRPHPSEEGGFKLLAYDTADWSLTTSLDIPNPDARGLVATADGKRVFVALDELSVHEWDQGGKKLTKRFDLGSARVEGRDPKRKEDGTLFERLQLQSLKLSPDETQLAANLQFVENGHLVGQAIRVWDVSDGRLVHTIWVRPAEKDWHVFPSLSFADGGKTVGVYHTHTHDSKTPTEGLIEYDVQSGTEKRRLDLAAALGTEPGRPHVRQFVYSPDSKYVVVAGGFELKKWNWGPGNVEGPIRDDFMPRSHGVWLLDRASGKVVKPLVEHRSRPVTSVSLSADRKKINIRGEIPSRMDRDHGGWNWDGEFVEALQCDVATWEVAWDKIVSPADYWKLMGGAK